MLSRENFPVVTIIIIILIIFILSGTTLREIQANTFNQRGDLMEELVVLREQNKELMHELSERITTANAGKWAADKVGIYYSVKAAEKIL